MTELPITRPSLLVRLRDHQDQEAWQRFADLYAPLLYRYGRNHRLQDADAADLTQEVLRAVSGAIGRLDYDPQRGSFRSWLFTLANRKLCDLLTRQQRQQQAAGGSAAQERLDEVAAPADEEMWNEEHERCLFNWAVEQVRGEFTPATWQAFWLTAVEGKTAHQAGETLGLSVGAVYVARSRVQARLKERLRQDP
jgi:RNA polymerase sigma-70 factor (ECF subfamily)